MYGQSAVWQPRESVELNCDLWWAAYRAPSNKSHNPSPACSQWVYVSIHQYEPLPEKGKKQAEHIHWRQCQMLVNGLQIHMGVFWFQNFWCSHGIPEFINAMLAAKNLYLATCSMTLPRVEGLGSLWQPKLARMLQLTLHWYWERLLYTMCKI